MKSYLCLLTILVFLSPLIQERMVASPPAYVANTNDGTVSVIDTNTNTVLTTISEGLSGGLNYLAITPDYNHVYITNAYPDPGTVFVINTTSNTVVGPPITVGNNPKEIAITPNGQFAYVTNYDDDSVSIIQLSSNTVAGSPLTVGSAPYGIAITPNGQFAYVTNSGDGTVSVIQLPSNTIIDPINVGTDLKKIAITPDSTKAYSSFYTSATHFLLDILNLSTKTYAGSISAGDSPYAIAFTPDGAFAYVTNVGNNTVSVINTSTNTPLDISIPVGVGPYSIAITPIPVSLGSPAALLIENIRSFSPLKSLKTFQ
jgi:YVTN family beta-propeller protein